MKRIFCYLLVFIVQIQVLNAQDYHPNQIRKIIYDSIFKDIESINPTYLNKQIWVDPSISVFEEINNTAFGVEFSGPNYRYDDKFCTVLPFAKCVDKNEIDKFKLVKIYNEHKDVENVDFFGVYAALDHWQNLIRHSIEISMLKTEISEKEIVIPIKHIFFVKEKVVVEHLFYRFILDNQFKIKKMDKIKFL